MFKKIKSILRSQAGMSELVNALIAIPAIIGVTVICIVFVAKANKIEQVDNFANELLATAGQIGKCDGMTIDKRYNELVDATGLKPEYKFSAMWYDSLTKTVQYGDTITLELTLDTDVVAFFDLRVPSTIVRKKTTQSEQYWK